jgi:hypothetical protein
VSVLEDFAGRQVAVAVFTAVLDDDPEAIDAVLDGLDVCRLREALVALASVAAVNARHEHAHRCGHSPSELAELWGLRYEAAVT